MTSSLQQFLSGRPDPFVPGYRVLARAWDDLRTIVFSAEDLRTGARVLIKVPRSQHPSAQDLEQLRRDYEIGKSIDSEHVVKPLAHLAHEGGHFVIVDDDGSRPIGESFDAGGRSLLPSLEFGVRLADGGRIAAPLPCHAQEPQSVQHLAAPARLEYPDHGLLARLQRGG